MHMNARREPRRKAWAAYSLCWQDEHGQRKSTEVYSTDRSASGVRIRSPHPLNPGMVVYLDARGEQLSGNCTVRHCAKRDRAYIIGGGPLERAGNQLLRVPANQPHRGRNGDPACLPPPGRPLSSR